MGIFLVLLLMIPPMQNASSFTPSNSDNGPAVNQEDHPDDDFDCDPAFEDCTSDSDGDGTPDWDDDCPTQAGPESNYGCPEGVEPDDSDGDGVYDYEDLCPNEYGTRTDGCPQGADSDGDGVPDSQDLCPNEYGTRTDGCPQHVDSDGDGVPDNQDNCPNTGNSDQADFNNDGSGDVCSDADGDGYFDSFDQCPSEPAVASGDGCPAPTDSDGDGINDDVDACPSQAENFNGYQDTDGCPDTLPVTDSDGDGVPDDIDQCPNEYGTQANGCPQVDSDGDGVPDSFDACPNEYGTDPNGCPLPDGGPSYDSDGDGVPDSSDACPSQRENFNEYQDRDGCPDTIPNYIDIIIQHNSSIPGCESNYSCFSPFSLNISVGDSVTWYNDDSAAHTVTAGTPEDGLSGWFDSSMMVSGQTFEHTFTQAGTYPYYDIVHPWAIGEIIVSSEILDFDGDGVPDNDDVCPSQFGTYEYFGCSNMTELCKANYGSDYYYNELEDICDYNDSDGDGVPDSEDSCPNEYGTLSNGCPSSVDSDGDGVPDDEDDCPFEYGTYQNYGCPDDDNSGIVIVDFDSIDTSSGIVSGSAVENYLAGYGIEVVDEGTGTLRDFTIWEGSWDKGIYAIATSSPNGFFRNYGNEAYSYSFYFDFPLDRFEFTRASYDASFGGIVSSSWNAQAFDSNGNSLGTVGEGQGSYYSIPPPVIFSFDGPDIVKVTFYRNSVNTYAGIAQVPLDNLVLTYSSSSEVEPDVSPELERLVTLGMEAYENRNCNLALNYFNQALALHEYEAFVKWFIGAIYSDCIGDHETALTYLEDALVLAKSTPEIPEESIVEIQNTIDAVKELISILSSTTTPSTQFLDLNGTWKGTVEFSVWFDYYPAPVTCSYVGNLEMQLRQTGDSVTGSSSLDVTKATTPTGCFSWFESYGYGQISGDVFGSAFSGTYGSNQFTGRFTSDLFEGEFSQQGTNSVSGSFSLIRQDAPTVPKSTTPTPTPIAPPTIMPKLTPIAPPTIMPKLTPIAPPTITPTPVVPPTITPTPVVPAPSLVTFSVDTDRTTYNQGNLVTINAEIDGITSNANIAISVIDPSGNVVMTRSLSIDDTGSIPFKISHGTTAGSYKVTASVNINGQNYEDKTQFTIKKDLAGLSIKSVSTTDQQGNLVDSFSKGSQGYIKIVLSSDSFMSDSLITITVLDSDLIALGTSSIKTSISSDDSEIILSFYIPDDTSDGIANIYVNAFTDWPSNGGVPLTREGSTEIGIGVTTTSSPITTQTKITPSTDPKINQVSIPVGTGTLGCELSDLCYFPSTITINQGETVQWNNDDNAAHTVTSGNPNEDLDNLFDSGLFMAGTTYKVDFNNKGSFEYFCMVHPWMEGTVIVK